jgi:hypothetical protein
MPGIERGDKVKRLVIFRMRKRQVLVDSQKQTPYYLVHCTALFPDFSESMTKRAGGETMTGNQ